MPMCKNRMLLFFNKICSLVINQYLQYLSNHFVWWRANCTNILPKATQLLPKQPPQARMHAIIDRFLHSGPAGAKLDSINAITLELLAASMRLRFQLYRFSPTRCVPILLGLLGLETFPPCCWRSSNDRTMACKTHLSWRSITSAGRQAGSWCKR